MALKDYTSRKRDYNMIVVFALLLLMISELADNGDSSKKQN
jgi:hypothetical protein